MFWSKSTRTRWRAVFVPILMSARMTGSCSGGRPSSRRLSSAVGPSAPVIDAVPRSTSAPSRLTIRISVSRAPAGGLAMTACTSSPLEDGVAVVRRQATRLEPRLAPEPLAEWRKLAEVSRPFYRAPLEAEPLRRRVVVDRDVIVIDLFGQHLPWVTPWADQLRAVVGDVGFERFPVHGRPQISRF